MVNKKKPQVLEIKKEPEKIIPEVEIKIEDVEIITYTYKLNWVNIRRRIYSIGRIFGITGKIKVEEKEIIQVPHPLKNSVYEYVNKIKKYYEEMNTVILHYWNEYCIWWEININKQGSEK